jgi:hypothetical protein
MAAMEVVSMTPIRESEFPVSTEKFPVPAKKFPVLSCSGNSHTHIEVANKFLVFANAQGICPQRFEMTAGIRAIVPKKPRIRKNSLLNSLFSGNLRITTDPYGSVPDESRGARRVRACEHANRRRRCRRHDR